MPSHAVRLQHEPISAGCRQDAWQALKPGEDGFSYDGRANPMLGSRFSTRLDRVLTRLSGWRLGDIQARCHAWLCSHAFTQAGR